jgi:purine nucleoside phosphorylase
MRCLGAEAVVVTNASGGLHPDWDVGTIVAMHDHLSLPTLSVSRHNVLLISDIWLNDRCFSSAEPQSTYWLQLPTGAPLSSNL